MGQASLVDHGMATFYNHAVQALGDFIYNKVYRAVFWWVLAKCLYFLCNMC